MGSRSKKTDSAGVGAFVVILIIIACIYGWFNDDSDTEDAGDFTDATQSSEQASSDSFVDLESEEPSAELESTSEEPPSEPTAPESEKKKVELCGAPNNPYGYNFCGRGGLVYDPPGDVCVYFDCIDYFNEGKGYMVQCGDDTYSMSGGRRGVCSYHDGHQQDVYDG